MRKKIGIIIFIGGIILLMLPYILWERASEKELEVLIIDKTVPEDSYREHQGIVWALNFNKYIKADQTTYDFSKDYVGFVPLPDEQYEIRSLEAGLEKEYDLIYMADTYGVYEEEFYQNQPQGERSPLIYGGLTPEEIAGLKENIYRNQTPFIAEFNSFASPTGLQARRELANLLGVEWTGWIGRYFEELDPAANEEITPWMVRNYESQYEVSWKFNQGGLVLVGEDDQILVLEEQKDYSGVGVDFALTEKGEDFFGEDVGSRYNYWFDILKEQEAETLANYDLDVTEEGRAKLKEYNIPEFFPAVTRSDYFGVPIYYFAGDYADIEGLPSFFKYRGLDHILRGITGLQKDRGDRFYYHVYLPMMDRILQESHELKDEKEENAVKEFHEGNVSYNSRIQQDTFEVYRDGAWEKMVIKGVNMGMAKPGLWPGEAGITFEEYYRWMGQIADMGANTLRVYTIHPPEFYQALWLHNQNAPKPLYVMHGVWIEEDPLEKTLDAFTPEIVQTFKAEMEDVVDVIHGNARLKERPGHASGEYSFDVSPYVSAWILGIEWYPLMVENTNEIHKDLEEYDGEYFYTDQAEALEKWLASKMDFITDYEVKNYGRQRPVSFTNWPTTDLLDHPAEPSEEEDLVTVDPNRIHPKDTLQTGYFASYHVYPYYPDFLNYEEKYLDFIDHRGERNNYAGYLNDLIEAHEMPVIIAEFGIPASRGKTHENPFGWNQGNISEEKQGEIGVRLFEDMLAQGAAGGLVFTWQDEWFKRTWNTMELDNPDRRPYWSNVQTNEQRFGLLSFDTHKKPLDGDREKWKETERLQDNPEGLLRSLYMDHDEAYLYLMLEFDPEAFNNGEGNIFVFFNTLEEQGNTTIPFIEDLVFEEGIDFILEISDDEEESRIWVDGYYDPFYYQYGYQSEFLEDSEEIEKNSGVFHPIRFALSKPMIIPSTGEEVPFDYYETGKLKEGVGNPESKDYDSLADYHINGKSGRIEIRIPWLLLNAKDPSQKEIMGDLWSGGMEASEFISSIEVSVAMGKEKELLGTLPEKSGNRETQRLIPYRWENWDSPSYRERLKVSYDIFRNFFTNSEINDE